MNIRIYFLGVNNSISRKEQKTIKDQLMEIVMEIYKKKKPINDLKKIPINTENVLLARKERAIYAETETTRENIDHLFPKKICKYTNYLLGKLDIKEKKILYLIDIDDLFYMGNEYVIWPSDETKKMFVTIN